jgi:hypothetical protein
MAWNIEVVDGCAVVRMNTNKVNVQNDHFFADLHGGLTGSNTSSASCRSC